MKRTLSLIGSALIIGLLIHLANMPRNTSQAKTDIEWTFTPDSGEFFMESIRELMDRRQKTK